MNFRFFLPLIAFLLIAASVASAPLPPAGLKATFEEGGVKISWEHAGGEGISFNVYRGSGVEDAEPIASVSEIFFVDRTTKAGEKYFYFVTAIDGSGESDALGSISITPLAIQEKPFNVELVEPVERTIDRGQTSNINFVLGVESQRFEELQNLEAILINEGLGLEQDFVLDSSKRLFLISVPVPEKEAAEVLQTTYRIQVTALLEGEPFSESMDVDLVFAPASGVNVWQVALNFFWFLAPVFVIVAAAGAAVVVWGAWSSRRKAERDKIRLEWLEVQGARKILRYDMLRRRISRNQFAEQERELQGKQVALEKKLGLAKKGINVKTNPFEGYSPQEIREITQLIKMIKKPSKDETQEALRTRLVGAGKSEKIAKKVSELVFRQH